MAPKRAMERKTVPVTSSHNWWMALPKERSVALVPRNTALRVLLRPACSLATRATAPIFRKAETLPTTLDFSSLRGYNVAAQNAANRSGKQGI